MAKKKLYVYLVKYMSTFEDDAHAKETEIKSKEELEEGQDIIVSRTNKGVFIGKVISDCTKNINNMK